MQVSLMPPQASVDRELKRIVTALRHVEDSLTWLAPLFDSRSLDGARSRQRRRRLPAARRAALKLQGQYLGLTRHLRPRQNARVKAVRAARGVSAAVVLARRLGR